MATFRMKEKVSKPTKEHFSQVPQRQAKTPSALQAKGKANAVIQDNRQQSLQLMKLKANLGEEDKLTQHKSYVATHSKAYFTVNPIASTQTHPLQRMPDTAKAFSGGGLPNQLKSGMEALSGMSLDHVNVHYNSSKPAAVQAHAYAQGSDIHLASGQEKHLPHELGHVVQQAQGKVKPTVSIGGMAVNDNPSLENEADRLGVKALQMKTETKID
ncbi:eCIS core domain-containing protein [Shewanella sp. A14]